MSMMNPGKSDHVLCSRLGTEEFIILSMDDRHYNLESTKTGVKTQIFKAHCHVTHDLIRANHQRRIERANQIGRNKRKP